MQGQPLGQPEGSSIHVNSSQFNSSQFQPYSDTSESRKLKDIQEFNAAARAYRAATKG